MNVKLGLSCVYRPRVPYGRQHELFCFVTRIVDAEKGLVDLISFPANSEPVHYNNVPQQSETIAIHCWEPAREVAGETAALREMITKLEARIVTLEKRQPNHKDQARAQTSLHDAAVQR